MHRLTTILMETRKKMAKFLLTNFVRREKRWQRFYKLSKKMTKIYQVFLVFFGVLGLYRLFRGVGIGWAVFESKRSTGCRDMRG